MAGILQRAHRAGCTTLLGCLVVFIFSFLAFYSQTPEDLGIHSDSVRYLLSTRDCLEGHGCHLRLGPFGVTSILGVSHGALQLHLLATVFWLGGGTRHYFILAALLSALAVALVFLLGRKLAGYTAGFAAALVCFYLWKQAGFHRLMWNPTLLPLPGAVYVFACACYLATRKMRYLLAAALALAVGIQLHVAYLFQVLGLVFLGLASAPGSRLRRMLIGLGVLMAVVKLGSPAMLLDVRVQPSLWEPAEVPGARLAPLLLYLGMGVFLSLALYWQRNSFKTLQRVVLFLLVCFWPQVILFAALAPGQSRYIAFLTPGIALMFVCAALLLKQLWLENRTAFRERAVAVARYVLAVITGGMIVLALAGSVDGLGRRHREPLREEPGFSMTDARRVAGYLHGELGWSYPEVFRRLRGGGRYWELLNGLSYHLPAEKPGQQSAAGGSREVAVFKVPTRRLPETLPRGWKRLAETGAMSLVAYLYRPALEWDRFQYCFSDPGGKPDCAWLPGEYRFETPVHPRDSRLLAARATPGLNLAWMRSAPGRVLLFRIPAQSPPETAPRTMIVAGHNLEANCKKLAVSPEALVVGCDWSDPAFTRIFMPPAVVELKETDLPLYRAAARTGRGRPETRPRSRITAERWSQVARLAGGRPPAQLDVPGMHSRLRREPALPLWGMLMVAFFHFLAVALAMLTCCRCRTAPGAP